MKWMKNVLCACATLAAVLSSGAALCDETIEHAVALTAQERYSEARDIVNQLLEREPGYFHARLLHGILRAREGRVDEAIDIFETLRRDHPEMTEPYNNLAVLYALQGRLDDARGTLIVALERGPDAIVYANLGDVYMKLARQAYRRARELSSDDGAAREPTMDTTFPLPEESDDSPGADVAGAEMRDAAMSSPDAEMGPEEPTRTVQSSVQSTDSSSELLGEATDGSHQGETTAPVTVAEQRDAVVERLEVVDQSQVQASASSGEFAVVSDAEEEAAEFCARAGGFTGRRDVADAAFWLQSYGAEVVEVRHEEGQVARSHRVYIAPLASLEEAAAKVREIRARGVKDVAVIKDGTLANGISFGVYREANNMRRRVSALDKLGYDIETGAADIDVVQEYVIKARAKGTPDALRAAWAPRFSGHAIRRVDCS